MIFTNHLKAQEKRDQEPFSNLETFKIDSQNDNQKQRQNGFVFDITHSFAKENLINQHNQNIANDTVSPVKGISGSPCSSMQQFSNRASNQNQSQSQYPFKNNLNLVNQTLVSATCPTTQNNPLNTQLSLGISSQIQLTFEDIAKSPCKNNLPLYQYQQLQLQSGGQKGQFEINSQNFDQYNKQFNPFSTAHQKNNSMYANQVTSLDTKTLFIPLNQILNSTQTNQDTTQSISQNNSSLLCNTNAKSSFRSNSTIFQSNSINNNSQISNLNVKNILKNNSELNYLNINTNNFYPNSNSIDNINIKNDLNTNKQNDNQIKINSNDTNLNSNIINNNYKSINNNNANFISSINSNSSNYNINLNNNNQNSRIINNTSFINSNCIANTSSNNINANNSFLQNNYNLQIINNNFNNQKQINVDNKKLEIGNKSFLGEQQTVNTNINNKCMLNSSNSNNVSFVANCNNNTIVKALEKNMDQSQQHIQHLINSSQTLQNSYTLEVERYIEQLNELKEKQEKCEIKQKKKKQELIEIQQIISQHEKKQEYNTYMVLSNEENRRKCIEETFNNHQQLDIVLQKIKNLILVIPDSKMHEQFFSSTQPLESALKQLCENKRDIIMHILREKVQQIHINECLNAFREDFNSYIMQNTEYTLQYEEYSEVLDSLKTQYPIETEYLHKNFELTSQKDLIAQKIQEVKQNHEYIQNQIQFKEKEIIRLQESSQFIQTRLEQARKNKQSAPDYQSYENQFQLFLSESFDQNAYQFYKDFIKIFDTEFLQNSISQFKGDSNQIIQKVIQFQGLLLQETTLVLSMQTTQISEDLRRIQDQKRELMVELNQIDMLRDIILSILSYDQLLLNVSMCVRNMKRKDVIIKKTQFTFRFQAQCDILSTTEDYMRINKDILMLEGEKKQHQFQVSETLKDISQLKSQQTQINSNLDENEIKFRVHFANECVQYYEQYLAEKKIVIKDLSFTYGKQYVEKLEQEIKEEFQKANTIHLEKIKEQTQIINQKMSKITEKRQLNFKIIEYEIKPQYENYKTQQKEAESKTQCLSSELADIISKERMHINQLNTILSDQFDLKNKKFVKGSALSNLQELMQQSEDEALQNYNQTLELMIKQNNKKQSEQEICQFSKQQLLREKMGVIQEELDRMTQNDIQAISHLEKLLIKSESVMKEYHSKIEQVHSVLKDQLKKMNLDSETIFNTFNLNFSSQVLNLKDQINRNQDRMKTIAKNLSNGNNNTKDKKNNDQDVKRTRCSKSMHYDASKQQNTANKQQINQNISSQIQSNISLNSNPIPQPKYGKITIDMNSLSNITDPMSSQQNFSKRNQQTLQSSQQSLLQSSNSFNMNKENHLPLNNINSKQLLNQSNKYINWQLPQNKLNQSQRDDMLKQQSSMSSNCSDIFFNSQNASKNNRFLNSCRSQSQINLNKQNSGGTSGRIPSSILSDPLYSELTNRSSRNIQVTDTNKSINQIPSTSNLMNMSSMNSPPSISESKSKQVKRANSFNTTSSQQMGNMNTSGGIARQIHKIANGNNQNSGIKRSLSRKNSSLLFNNINNNQNNNSIIINNNTYRDFSPKGKNYLKSHGKENDIQNINLSSVYGQSNNKAITNQKLNNYNDQDKSDQNITLNLSNINHIQNGSMVMNNPSHNYVHNNSSSAIHSTSLNNITNYQNSLNCPQITQINQEQASAFLDMSSLNMITGNPQSTNRNELSGIFTQTSNGYNITNQNNSKTYNKNYNLLNENKQSLIEDNSFCLNSGNDKSMLTSEINNQKAQNNSQFKRVNSLSQGLSSMQSNSNQQYIQKKQSNSNSKCIEIYKMYGVCKDNLVKKQIYDPINNYAKPTSFGYAKRLLRINDKTQNLEFIKEEFINQQSRKTIEQAYSKSLIKHINIPPITSSILEYKNEYKYKEPQDQLVQKFVNCNSLPFSIEIEKMGKIECIALHEDDLLLLMDEFSQ